MSLVANNAGTAAAAPDGLTIGGNETIDAYDTGTFVLTFPTTTAFTAEQTATVSYVRLGKQVTLHFPEKNAASNSAGNLQSSDTIPAALRPAQEVVARISTIDNSVFQGGILNITAGGTVIFVDGDNVLTSDTFAGANNAGWASTTISYIAA